MKTSTHLWTGAQEAPVQTVTTQEDIALDVWVPTEDGPEGLRAIHAMLTNGQRTDRQIAERARDHLYN